MRKNKNRASLEIGEEVSNKRVDVVKGETNIYTQTLSKGGQRAERIWEGKTAVGRWV